MRATTIGGLVTTAVWGVVAIGSALADPETEAAADLAAEDELEPDEVEPVTRHLAGSVQLAYLAVPTEADGRELGFDGATVELSVKLAMDLGDNLSANVKVCVACHGLEIGMAFLDVRVSERLNFRIGRFTPSFGEFPQRHDPANHHTTDKPLPYDMGRMLRTDEWNMSVLPAPWVDNGIEANGTYFFGAGHQVDYAAFAVGGPRAGADPADFDYVQSRSPERYYIDNNSQPSVGARVAVNLDFRRAGSLRLGASGFGGTYDPDRELSFLLVGADAVFERNRFTLRAEYLRRRTQLGLGDDPAERFRHDPALSDDFFVKDGFYAELEVPLGPAVLIGRFDGMRRFGNVVATSALRRESAVFRYTAGASMRLRGTLRGKLSAELYDFSDFEDELAIQFGVVSTF